MNEQERIDRLFASTSHVGYSAVTGPIDKPHDIVSVPLDQLTGIGEAEFAAEASDLGWKPGFWPEQLDLGRAIGNGMLFHQSYADSGSTLYRQTDGHHTVTIFND